MFNAELPMEKCMADNVVLNKSTEFAIRVVKLYRHLCDEKKNMFYPNSL